MSGRPHVVIVDPYSSGAAIAGIMRRAGLEPVCVTSLPPPAPVLTATFRPGDFTVRLSEGIGRDALAGELAGHHPVAVVAGTESGVLLADFLAASLTPTAANDPDLARARRHKGDMVKALERRGLAAIATTCVADPAEAVRWAGHRGLAGRDLVVKPAMSAGTEGVSLLPGGEGLRETVAGLLGGTNLMGLLNEEVVVQERVRGTEYVVDTVSCGGRVSVTDICRYTKTRHGPGFATYESIEVLPFDTPEGPELVAYVTDVLDALGIRFGPAHTEVMLTASGPVLIETAARPAGADLPALCELATGDNGIHRLARHLTGRGDPPSGYQLDWHVMGVYFGAGRSGRVTDTTALQRIKDLPSCRHLRVGVRDGDTVSAVPDLLTTLGLGWAVLAHRDPQTVRSDLRAIREIEKSIGFV